MIEAHEYRFIEQLGLLLEEEGGSKTLGRVYGYLLLAEQPKTLDQIADDLIFSKATASMTIRQGMMMRLFEKTVIPGKRKDHYLANTSSWLNVASQKRNMVIEWRKLMEYGLSLLNNQRPGAKHNLEQLKDYLEFVIWFLSDIDEYYERWKKGERG